MLAIMRRGVSAIAGACDAQGRPAIMRCMGSDVSADGARVTVFLSLRQACALLGAVRATGHIAVVFSEPHSHRTVQLKARYPELRPAAAADEPALARYLRAMEDELQRIGHAPELTRAMLASRRDDLVAVTLMPAQAFDQTPGPRAGTALGPAEPSPREATAAALAARATPLAARAAPLTAVHGGDDAEQPPGVRPSALGERPPALGEIRASLDGLIPAVMATADAQGVPNVAYISQVSYVDERHVALSFQFFNKTRQNILVNPRAEVLLIDPSTAAFHRLRLRYLRTETEGPLFEGMKAQLAGIASHSGMAGVFRLLGSDVYAVEAIERVPGEPRSAPPARCGLLNAVRRGSERLARASSLAEALDAAMATLTGELGIRHAMVLMLDEKGRRLYTVASTGYATSGVGSEVELGDGVIGVAARERTPVRIMHMASAYLYSHAIRRSLKADVPELELATDIPYPGLAEPHSQLAAPILSGGRLLGVLFVESPDDLQFGFEDEDVLVTLAGHLGAAIDLMQAGSADFADSEPGAPDAPGAPAGAPLQVRRFAANDSVFVDGSYLIKGVAGAILWKLLREFTGAGRTDFSNRELRLDPSIRLPDVADNLEARLVLLQRRLVEHGPHLRIEKTGRGRFRLAVARPVEMVEVAG